MSDATEAQRRAILTRAATCEAARQQAVIDRDFSRQAMLERELAALWRRHGELERVAAQAESAAEGSTASERVTTVACVRSGECWGRGCRTRAR